MADSVSESHLQEIVDSMLGDIASGVVKQAFKSLLTAMFSEAGSPWQRRAGAMLFGTPHTDEQMYWRMIDKAEEKSSPETVDQYLIELAELPPEKQNIHQINTIQSWMMEFKKNGGFKEMDFEKAIDLIIDAGAEVIAKHAKRIARNRNAWVAITKIQDISQPIITHNYDNENRKLENELENQKRSRKIATRFLIGICIVAVLLLAIATL
jgi:hypothetical protein